MKAVIEIQNDIWRRGKYRWRALIFKVRPSEKGAFIVHDDGNFSTVSAAKSDAMRTLRRIGARSFMGLVEPPFRYKQYSGRDPQWFRAGCDIG